ncbi:MAG TPA: NUDIX domain-containing protein [Bryobacteraceae bacterium]|nr:NUDIX domain-containing protein [Bryobacteraceae bacterium]
MQRAGVRSLVAAFVPAEDRAAQKSQELILQLLDHSAQPFSREQFQPGHITATGLVLHPQHEAILLVLHRRLGRWLLPGGHVEEFDVRAWDTARREVIEETGARLAVLADPKLVGLDVHGIPPRASEPFHLHHDLVFAFQAQAEKLEASEEARAVVWCGEGEFDRYRLPGSIRRSFQRALMCRP